MRRDNAYNPLLKSYPDSDKINAVSEGAECLYTRLIAASDDAGRYPADPKWVLARLFTTRMEQGMQSDMIAERIKELQKVGLIIVYEVGGKQFLELVDVYKTVRKDVKLKVLYPQRLPETVTDALRTRNEFGPLDPHQTHTTPHYQFACANFLSPNFKNSDDEQKQENPKVEATPQKKNRFDQDDLALARHIWDAVRSMLPEAKAPPLESWANTIRLAREADKRTLTDLREVFDLAHTDDFWRPNILSPQKLRKQFDQLDAKLRHGNRRNGFTPRRYVPNPGQEYVPNES